MRFSPTHSQAYTLHPEHILYYYLAGAIDGDWGLAGINEGLKFGAEPWNAGDKGLPINGALLYPPAPRTSPRLLLVDVGEACPPIDQSAELMASSVGVRGRIIGE